MTEHDDQPHVQLGNRVFDAALHRRARAVHHVPRHADHEHVAHPRVEEQFGRDSRIRARDDDRSRILPLGRGANVFGAATRVLRLSFGEPRVARHQFLQRFVSAPGGAGFAGGRFR